MTLPRATPIGLTAADALDEAAALLAGAGIDHPRREARLLLSHCLKQGPEVLIGRAEEIELPDPDGFRGLVRRRAGREPLSHITGSREFWSRPFRVSRDVLDPRPDTETLIEAALALRGDLGPTPRLADFGVGSGSILLTLLAEWPEATGVGIDLSEAALGVARSNAEALGVAARARLERRSWGAGLAGPFDLIVSNPPYIPSREIEGLEPEVRDHEPRLALDGGADGLLAYRGLFPHAARLLAPAGWLLLEIGRGQGPAVRALGEAAGLVFAGARPDLGSVERVLRFHGRADGPARGTQGA